LLHLAVFKNHLAMAELLLQKDANVNGKAEYVSHPSISSSLILFSATRRI
jgi:hypothetical protein